MSNETEPVELTKAGNPLKRGFTLVDCGDWNPRLREQFGSVETFQEPYCQVVYGVTAKGHLVVVTFAEGDVQTAYCDKPSDLEREIASAQEYYAKRV